MTDIAAGPVAAFARSHRLQVLAIATDPALSAPAEGRTIPGFSAFEQVLPDRGQSARWGIRMLPAVLLIPSPEAMHSRPEFHRMAGALSGYDGAILGTGALSGEEIARRIALILGPASSNSGAGLIDDGRTRLFAHSASDCRHHVGSHSNAKHTMTFLTLKRSFLMTSVALMLLTQGSDAEAGFLQDFYDQSGSQTTSTEAGIYSSSTMDMVTGGRFVVKAPRQDFQPYYAQAPHLKAGCGGIDVFLGSFSIPSKEEFLNFLRSIGTALPGLAFQLALQSLAPDLNEQVSQFRDMLMRMSSQMGDSCQAAQAILDNTGASAWLNSMGHRAKNSLRASGVAEDQSDADFMTRSDGGKTLTSVPNRLDSAGNVIESAEMNLTWALLKGNNGGKQLDRAKREAMMSLVGTVVYVNQGSGASMVSEERSYPELDLLHTLLGAENTQTLPTDAFVYRCDDEDRCLHPTKVTSSDLNIANAI